MAKKARGRVKKVAAPRKAKRGAKAKTARRPAGQSVHLTHLRAIEQMMDAHNVPITRPDGTPFDNVAARLMHHFGTVGNQNRTLASTGAMAGTAGPDPTNPQAPGR